MSDTVRLARELIQKPSVTPDDAGCQALLRGHLEPAGFNSEAMTFEEVDNLWLTHGREGEGPLLVFAGHTDVVPVGDLADWHHDPFAAVLENGWLHGRGAADMKGSLAAMTIAAARFASAYPNHNGRLALLITSDEEGPADYGTVKVVEALKARGDHIDMAVVGEPSSTDRVGDIIKNGRRGSLLGYLRIRGRQGHVAYPHLAVNPLHAFAPALQALVATEWDQGNDYFPPTSFQIANAHCGTGATNVIPGTLELQFSFRFSTEVTAAALEARVRRVLDEHGLDYELNCELKGEPFLTDEGLLVDAAIDAVRSVTGEAPVLSTAGGTSDGRFIAGLMNSQVVELGPINATIHQVNECVRAADLDRLTDMYLGIMERVLLK